MRAIIRRLAFPIALLAIGAIFVGAAAATPSINFAPQSRYPVGSGPSTASIGDLNRDGLPDIAVNDFYGSTITILTGSGGGAFGPGMDYPLGPAPCSSVIADFNVDGLPDLAVSTHDAGVLFVQLGNGDGTFGPPATLETTFNANTLTCGDYNLDGSPDLVVASYWANTLCVFLGRGDGTFEPRRDLPVGTYASTVITADFNGDQKPDLAVSNSGSGNFAVLLGNGDGTFASPMYFGSFTTPPDWIRAADFTGDGRLDLVVRAGSVLWLVLGNGDGTFAAQSVIPGVSDPSCFEVADLDRDGRFDLAVPKDDELVILAGNGDGTFRAPVSFAVGTHPGSASIADLNGDGWPDVVVPNWYSNDVSVLLNLTGTDTTPPARPSILGIDYAPWGCRTWWAASRAPDFNVFRLYRGSTLDFAMSPENLIATLRDTCYFDSTGTTWLLYKICAVDSSGNASAPSCFTPPMPTPVRISVVAAEAGPRWARLEWSSDTKLAFAALYRCESDMAWVRLAGLTPGGTGHLAYEDRTVLPGARYGYRLGLQESDGEHMLGETWVTIPRPLLLAVEVRPNPASLASAVWVTLPVAARATLRVLDVSGRQVWSSELEGRGAGQYQLSLGGGRLAPGVYELHLSQGDLTVTTRAVIMR
jgi:hypothetical protein